ncbi:SAV_2336 N-terminal domain-related protein, partial [Streptomyces sp. NPDC048508]|uniref:SAV_2336 N-terminal domain-related protein n=1 Tax=Streptomyces sp. NPDC048508 TaxID=3365561 RepID=UPI003714C059
MIERFGSLLADLYPAGQPPTSREVAELIWLAKHLTGDTGQPGPTTVLPEGQPLPSSAGSSSVPEPAELIDNVRSESESTRLYLPQHGSPNEAAAETEAEQAAPVRVSGPTVLPRKRELARALRPLKRRVPSTASMVLDEEATASRIADHHHWIPVLVPAEDRWLNLLIVLDGYSESGIFWEPLARELRTLCQQIGAFRDVRLCHLLARSDGSPGLGMSAATPPQLLRPPASAIDSTGRTATLILTDGVAPAWRSDMLLGALRQWAASGPTAILQALPEQAWERTVLAPVPGRFRSTEVGGANSSLLYTAYGLRPDRPKPGAIPLPVLGISPEWLAPWAQAIAEPAAFDAAAILLPASATRSRSHSVVLDVNEAPRQEGTFEDFRAQAQPRVFRLAAYLAAAPLNLAVMRTVQSVMLPESPLSDLAEIVYSGILRKVHGGKYTSDALGQAYEFIPGVRDRLLRGIRRDEADEVIAAVSAYVDRNAPAISARFTATVPDSDGTLALTAGARHWAEVHDLVRRRQGRRLAVTTRRDQATQDVATKAEVRRRELPHPTGTALLLTALPEEYNAVRTHLVNTEEIIHPNGTRVELGQLEDTAWNVALADLDVGTLTNASLTTQIVDWLNPETVLFVGIGGGLKDDIEIGDVVVATKIYTIRSSRQTPEGFETRPEVWSGSHRLLQAARSAQRDMPDVRVHHKPIAVGDVALAGDRSALAAHVRHHYNDAYAIAMEGYGAARAAYLNGQLDVLVIRGISDPTMANKHTADASGSRTLAAERAASVAVGVLCKQQPRHGNEDAPHQPGDGIQSRRMRAALLMALAEGAGGEGGYRAVGQLTSAVGLNAGASASDIAQATQDPARSDAVREWGEAVANLLAADPPGVAGPVAQAMERHAPGIGTPWYAGDRADFRPEVFLREVLGVQVVPQRSAAVPAALTSLPPRPGGFTGREDETAELLRSLSDSAAVLVTAVSGVGGIGKTALAVETAHLACEKGWFPGGVLFLDLHGYEEQPVRAIQALESLLGALGVPPEQVPAAADDRAVLYRSVLSERARERGAVLVLADNVSSPDQVRPLVQEDSPHRVLVTSRHRLPLLGAYLVPLDRLSSQQAYDLVDHVLRLADPEDHRVGDAPEMTEQLIDLCGHLPLALQIAAALLSAAPSMSVADFVEELAGAHDRLDRLGDGERSIRAAFELAYRRLSPEQARLLRLLALAPGPEASDEVVAALMNAKTAPVHDLTALSRAHLVESGSGRGRWRVHDLVGAFGASLVAEEGMLREEGEAARERVLTFYRRWTDAADARLRWLPGKAEPERFRDREEALTWLDNERAGLLAAVEWGREERFRDAAARLAENLVEYLERRQYFDDWIAVSTAAQKAAYQAGDHHREATAWNSLGSALQGVRRPEEAIDAYSRSRDIFQAAGDRRGEAMAWNSLGRVLEQAGRLEEAIDAHSHALDLHQDADDRLSEAATWNNLGRALRGAGRVEEAIDAHSRSRDMYQTTGNHHGEAMTWINLGRALQQAGRLEEAIDAHSRSRDMHQATGNHHGEAISWNSLGHALWEARRPEEAIDAYSRSRDIFQAAGDRRGEAMAWNSLGRVLEQAGRLEEAVDARSRSRDIFQAAGDRRGEAMAWNSLGRVLEQAGR